MECELLYINLTSFIYICKLENQQKSQMFVIIYYVEKSLQIEYTIL